jgi:hypothetical protein
LAPIRLAKGPRIAPLRTSYGCSVGSWTTGAAGPHPLERAVEVSGGQGHQGARVNGDLHGNHGSCGSVVRASRFLIGLVNCFATHDGIPLSHAAWRR